MLERILMIFKALFSRRHDGDPLAAEKKYRDERFMKFLGK